MEKTLLGIVSLCVLVCAPFAARADAPPYELEGPGIPELALEQGCGQNAPTGLDIDDPHSPCANEDRKAPNDEGSRYYDTESVTDTEPVTAEFTFGDDGYYLWQAGDRDRAGDRGRAGDLDRTYEEDAVEYEEAPPFYDVPVVVNDKVERFLKYFQGRGKKTFTRWLERSGGYMEMVKGILRDKGLPEDLTYLALIESGFNTHATSSAKAVGIWQFIPWTGKRYGLRVDWWIDERRDPEKATHAAAGYLETLYERFKSWYLAAAGYNAGEGNVVKAQKRHKTDDFWELSKHSRPLKKETRNYIPKYLAAMIIAKDPVMYGFPELNYNEPISYDKVRLEAPTDLKVIAKAAGTTVKEIKKLNPALKRWFTPPDYPGFEVNIPTGAAENFKQSMQQIPKRERLKFLTHRVRRGETLSGIADRYKTSISPIMYLNNLKRARFIREGSTLVVPVRENSRPAKSSKPERVPSGGTYTVKKGDTLWDISTRFNVPLKGMLKWNGLNRSDPIMPGQRLYLKEARLGDKPLTSLQ